MFVIEMWAERLGARLKSGVVILDTERVGVFGLRSWRGGRSIFVALSHTVANNTALEFVASC